MGEMQTIVADQVAREIAIFENMIEIHNLPRIFHYWSQRHLAPDLVKVFGSADIFDIFAEEWRRSLLLTGQRKIVSVGAGDGSIEIEVAGRLRASGLDNFEIECLELSPHLIGRGRLAATKRGLSSHVRFVETDLTNWRASETYAAAFANHSLHHIVALEHVFDELRAAIDPHGSFVINDMIGRNGHMRWPETEAMLSLVWKLMPDRYRYNHQLSRHEPEFVNWDCSTEGFEGVRAQDIMPELLKRFHPHRLVAWGGLTDVFVDRCFGHNLDPANPEDMTFIDGMAVTDRALILAGTTTPTQLIAVLRREPSELVSNGIDASMCVHPANS